MTGFTQIALVTDIPEGTMRSYQVERNRIVVCNLGGKFFALADECTHDAAPISDGKLEGGNLVCARHGAMFDVVSGAVTGPPAVIGIDKYEVKVEGNNILVRVD